MSLDSFNRTDDLFSLCGLNCRLCGYRLMGNCNGCFKDSSCAAVCPMAPCSVRHGNLQYCFECLEYPCKHYDGFDCYDTLVLHRNQRKDMQKGKEIEMDAYHAEQREKQDILNQLLESNDDGSRATFFCLAVNKIELEAVRKTLSRLNDQCQNTPLHEKVKQAEKKLRERFEQ